MVAVQVRLGRLSCLSRPRLLHRSDLAPVRTSEPRVRGGIEGHNAELIASMGLLACPRRRPQLALVRCVLVGQRGLLPPRRHRLRRRGSHPGSGVLPAAPSPEKPQDPTETGWFAMQSSSGAGQPGVLVTSLRQPPESVGPLHYPQRSWPSLMRSPMSTFRPRPPGASAQMGRCRATCASPSRCRSRRRWSRRW